MNDNLIFLTCHNDGISRAEKNGSGEWGVEHLMRVHKVTCLAEDTRYPGVIYAGTRGNGVWRSTDRGKNWQRRGLEGQDIMSLAVSPHTVQGPGIDQSLVYAGTKGALMFRSADGGGTWNELAAFREMPNRWWWFSPAEPPDKRPYVIQITLSPSDPDVVLAGVELGGVFRSDDGGDTWSRHLRRALRDCHSLKFHPTNGDWVYQAGGTGGGASLSRDGGVTWQKSNSGLAKSYGIVCGADHVKPEVWYVTVASGPFNAFGNNPKVGLYRSTAGAKFEPISWRDHPLNETPTALTPVPKTSGGLYVGLNNGSVMLTTDYGDSWERLPFNLGGVWPPLLVVEC